VLLFLATSAQNMAYVLPTIFVSLTQNLAVFVSKLVFVVCLIYALVLLLLFSRVLLIFTHFTHRYAPCPSERKMRSKL